MTDEATGPDREPSVTILMASFGRLELLKDAVESALCQQYPNLEIVIVDDGSDDEVIDWLRAIDSSEPRISVHFQDHQGVASARAHGLDQASTDLVCILDSDDTLAANAVRILVDAMTQNAHTQIVYTDIRELRKNGAIVRQRYRQYDSTRAMIMAILLKPRLPFKHSGTMFRRQTALELGSYNPALTCKIDVDLYLRFLQAGHLPRHVDQALVDFRMHKNSVSIDRLAGIRVWLNLIDQHGPSNPVYRFFIKTVRISAELLKRVYIELQDLR